MKLFKRFLHDAVTCSIPKFLHPSIDEVYKVYCQQLASIANAPLSWWEFNDSMQLVTLKKVIDEHMGPDFGYFVNEAARRACIYDSDMWYAIVETDKICEVRAGYELSLLELDEEPHDPYELCSSECNNMYLQQVEREQDLEDMKPDAGAYWTVQPNDPRNPQRVRVDGVVYKVMVDPGSYSASIVYGPDGMSITDPELCNKVLDKFSTLYNVSKLMEEQREQMNNDDDLPF